MTGTRTPTPGSESLTGATATHGVKRLLTDFAALLPGLSRRQRRPAQTPPNWPDPAAKTGGGLPPRTIPPSQAVRRELAHPAPRPAGTRDRRRHVQPSEKFLVASTGVHGGYWRTLTNPPEQLRADVERNLGADLASVILLTHPHVVLPSW